MIFNKGCLSESCLEFSWFSELLVQRNAILRVRSKQRASKAWYLLTKVLCVDIWGFLLMGTKVEGSHLELLVICDGNFKKLKLDKFQT